MKDKFKEDALYYVMLGGECLLAKASLGFNGKRLSFFFCDKQGYVKWSSITDAYMVILKAPSHVQIQRED